MSSKVTLSIPLSPDWSPQRYPPLPLILDPSRVPRHLIQLMLTQSLCAKTWAGTLLVSGFQSKGEIGSSSPQRSRIYCTHTPLRGRGEFRIDLGAPKEVECNLGQSPHMCALSPHTEPSPPGPLTPGNVANLAGILCPHLLLVPSQPPATSPENSYHQNIGIRNQHHTKYYQLNHSC